MAMGTRRNVGRISWILAAMFLLASTVCSMDISVFAQDSITETVSGWQVYSGIPAMFLMGIPTDHPVSFAFQDYCFIAMALFAYATVVVLFSASAGAGRYLLTRLFALPLLLVWILPFLLRFDGDPDHPGAGLFFLCAAASFSVVAIYCARSAIFSRPSG